MLPVPLTATVTQPEARHGSHSAGVPPNFKLNLRPAPCQPQSRATGSVTLCLAAVAMKFGVEARGTLHASQSDWQWLAVTGSDSPGPWAAATHWQSVRGLARSRSGKLSCACSISISEIRVLHCRGIPDDDDDCFVAAKFGG
eukprot:2814773-Rhodomonas_salina.2